MTTLISAEMQAYANADNALADYPSSVFSGIIGDANHNNSNTYHFSLEDQRFPAPGNYTNKWPDDMAPPGAWSRRHASASDKSMSTADMVKEWNRWVAVYNNRANDPRAKYVAEYIGWNGVGEAERLDFQAGSRTISSPDHKWHSHKGRRRRYYNSAQATTAFLSIDKGETIQQYLQGGDMAAIDTNEPTYQNLIFEVAALIENATQSDGPQHRQNALKVVLAGLTSGQSAAATRLTALENGQATMNDKLDQVLAAIAGLPTGGGGTGGVPLTYEETVAAAKEGAQQAEDS